MKKEDKKRDPMPPPDATPEEIGEFWDTHSLADYWDETEEVEFQVDLRAEENQVQSGKTRSDLPTTSEDASNTALDAVTDLALDTTIPAPIRRNMFKAFDRLCSALMDVPIGALERRSSEKRAESEARIKIIRENADQIAQQMKVDPEYALIAVNKYGQKILREQVNLDNISAIAANELKKTEFESSINQDSSRSNTVSTDRTANDSEEKTIDDDWLNNFETEARQKSTEDIQRRFARVLAGEIEKPGSYSIKALKTLGDMDQNVAALFKKLCSISTTLKNPIDGSIIDARVLSLDGDPAQNALSKYGLGFNSLNALSEYGLIISDYNSWFSVYCTRENENNSEFVLIRHQGKYWDILPLPEQAKKQEVKLYGVALSLVGHELFRIVDQEPMPEYTEDLKKFFAEQNLSMVEVNNQ